MHTMPSYTRPGRMTGRGQLRLQYDKTWGLITSVHLHNPRIAAWPWKTTQSKPVIAHRPENFVNTLPFWEHPHNLCQHKHEVGVHTGGCWRLLHDVLSFMISYQSRSRTLPFLTLSSFQDATFKEGVISKMKDTSKSHQCVCCRRCASWLHTDVWLPRVTSLSPEPLVGWQPLRQHLEWIKVHVRLLPTLCQQFLDHGNMSGGQKVCVAGMAG